MQVSTAKDEEEFRATLLAIQKGARILAKAARMEKALLAIKEIVKDKDGPYDCGWDTFDQIHDALDEGLKENNDDQVETSR